MKNQKQHPSPIAYKLGWQIAQSENEMFTQVNNRLKSIKAIHKLKRGELFLEVIEG
ncbi:hypothetical protein [uncultured Roseivirga sp.]|uniref:hypothetical protein n=1 Tax=uncultured Roseivirga sp. TaxID=543088 RepID=UPI0030D73B19|tara:strand:- start:53383 stop:53550 length:168 start_codon:yes stop_codon:yes gene_type:complete